MMDETLRHPETRTCGNSAELCDLDPRTSNTLNPNSQNLHTNPPTKATIPSEDGIFCGLGFRVAGAKTGVRNTFPGSGLAANTSAASTTSPGTSRKASPIRTKGSCSQGSASRGGFPPAFRKNESYSLQSQLFCVPLLCKLALTTQTTGTL